MLIPCRCHFRPCTPPVTQLYIEVISHWLNVNSQREVIMKRYRDVYTAVVLFFALCFIPVQLQSEQPDMTWGVVLKEHLTMDHFPQDTNASAVVLFDYGESVVAEDLYIDYYRHRRIKILSADGYDWGSHSIAYRAARRAQRVQDIEAHTINIDSAGNVTRHTLDEDSIFDEDIDGTWRRIRFTLPALQPGSVVEYRYRIASDNATLLHDWSFQTSIPVLWSEYHARIPNFLRYVQVIEGTHPLHRRDQVPYEGDRYLFDGIEYQWVMKDLPAIRREPFISTVSDYMSRIRFQLSIIQIPRMPVQNILNTWPDLIEELDADRNFGRLASGTRRIRRVARDVVDGLTDPAEKMRAIYRYVQTSIVWDGNYRVFASERLNSIYDNKTGNSADIALLLTAMLRAVDIDADPVILSTRSNGRIQTMYPIVHQFNHVITRVTIGRQYYLLDATNPYIPVGLLPYETMTDTGVLIKKDQGEWITIGSILPTRRSLESNLELHSDGTVNGTLTIEDLGYNAADRRRQLDNNTTEEYLQDVLGDDHSLIDVDTFAVAHRDEIDKPLITSVHISSSDYVSAVGDYVYINPWLTGRMNENPLRRPERTFPVELVYQRESAMNVELTIPEHFEVVETPRPVVLRLPHNAGHYRKRVSVSDNVIRMQREFELRQITFEPDQYQELREFFGQVVAHDNEQMVLRRIGDDREAAGSGK